MCPNGIFNGINALWKHPPNRNLIFVSLSLEWVQVTGVTLWSGSKGELCGSSRSPFQTVPQEPPIKIPRLTIIPHQEKKPHQRERLSMGWTSRTCECSVSERGYSYMGWFTFPPSKRRIGRSIERIHSQCTRSVREAHTRLREKPSHPDFVVDCDWNEKIIVVVDLGVDAGVPAHVGSRRIFRHQQ